MQKLKFCYRALHHGEPFKGISALPLLTRPPRSTLSGKSTVGQDVADHFHIPFIDGDSLHPKSNIAKMSSGTPLTDEDRLPWLALIRSTAEKMCKEQSDEIAGKTRSEEDGGLGRAGVVIACSALKKWYRDILRGVVKADPPPAEDLVSIACCSLHSTSYFV